MTQKNIENPFRYFRFYLPMFRKARRLVYTNAATQLSDERFTVDGDHGTYIVKIKPNEVLTCNCKAFKVIGLCSHVLAVAMILTKEETSSSGGSKGKLPPLPLTTKMR